MRGSLAELYECRVNVRKSKKVLTSVGVSVGVGIGMLVAPHRGEQMRGRVKAQADEGVEYLKQRGLAWRDSVADLVGKGKQAATERRLDEEAVQGMGSEGGPNKATA
jgi:gas vesicle protein